MKISFISQKEILNEEAIKGKDIREGIFKLICNDVPNFTLEDFITLDELNIYRRLYLTDLISQERGELAQLDKDVLNAIKNNSILSENI